MNQKLQPFIFLGILVLVILSLGFLMDLLGENILVWIVGGLISITLVYKFYNTIKNLSQMSNPKFFEIIKLSIGLILLLFPVLGGIIFFLEGMGVSSYILDYYSINDTIFSNDTPTFLGLCGIGGSILLNSVKIESNIK
jgi:hypothetical protein